MPRKAVPGNTEIARRLALTREALGYTEQGQFARDADITPNTYNPWEKDGREPSRAGALKLCKKYRLTMDWIYQGIPDGLPYGLVLKLIELGALPAPGGGAGTARQKPF